MERRLEVEGWLKEVQQWGRNRMGGADTEDKKLEGVLGLEGSFGSDFDGIKTRSVGL